MTPTTASSPADSGETANSSLEQLAAQVDRAVADIRALPDDVQDKAMALKSAVESFHRAGLEHIVRTLRSDPVGKDILLDLVREPAVYALFTMHGLVRPDRTTQVSRVIEMVRPYLQSHGGDVRLVDVRGSTVLVQLSGNCSGCSMSSVTLHSTVEEALKEHIPEIERVEVVPDETAPLVPLKLSPDPEDTHGWVPGPLVSELTDEGPFVFEADGTSVLLVPSGKGLRAWRNACAHQGLPLDNAVFDPETDTLTCPWHGFRFDGESGECFSAPQCQMEPFPLRIEDGRIWVRPS